MLMSKKATWDKRKVWKVAGPDTAAAAKYRDEIFDKIKPKGNWKNPIACWIDVADFDECNEACIWFTGSMLQIEERRGKKIYVRAIGYYLAVGS